MSEFSAPLPLSLYVHIPWCVRKCPYCDFNSHAVRDTLPEREYVDALLLDLEQELPQVWGRRLESVFIGGGTPSLLSPEALGRLLCGLQARLPWRPDLEVTLEANPGTFEQAKFSEFRAAGINRLSIGAQSFDDDLLQRIGRIHGGREAVRAAEIAHRAGFENFNLDLMFGLPGQTRAQSLADLETAIGLEPTHLSFYQLTLEPNTLFHHQPPVLPEDDVLWDMQLAGQGLMAKHGYTQYEVSAYARSAKRCRHNLNYWEFGDYLGIGAGAHGKRTDAASASITRRWKHRQPQQFMDEARRGTAAAGERRLSAEDAAFEFFLNALRLTEGFERSLFAERTGLAPETIEPQLMQAAERELLALTADRLIPTELGRQFLNELTEMFLPQHERTD